MPYILLKTKLIITDEQYQQPSIHTVSPFPESQALQQLHEGSCKNNVVKRNFSIILPQTILHYIFYF